MALDDFAAQAPSESVRGPQSIGKRKLRASGGAQTLENVSSNRSCPPLPIPGPSQGPPMAPGAISRSSRRHPGALQNPPGALTRLPRGSPPASCMPCGKPAITSQQQPACGHQPAVFRDIRKGSGGRRPKALKSGHRALRAKGTAVAKRYVGSLLPLF